MQRARAKPQPRKHRLTLDIELNEGQSSEEVARLFQFWLDQWLDARGRRGGALVRAVKVEPVEE